MTNIMNSQKRNSNTSFQKKKDNKLGEIDEIRTQNSNTCKDINSFVPRTPNLREIPLYAVTITHQGLTNDILKLSWRGNRFQKP